MRGRGGPCGLSNRPLVVGAATGRLLLRSAFCGGGGPSPNSAISDMYSSSIFLPVNSRRGTWCSSLTAIFGYMTSSSTAGTDYIVCNIRLVRTLPRFVSVGSTITTPWPIIFSKGTIQQGQLSQLHSSQIILALRNFYTLPNYFFYLVHCFLDTLRITGCHVSMKWFIFSRHGSSVFSANLALFD